MEFKDTLIVLAASKNFTDERSVLLKLSSPMAGVIWFSITASLVIGWIAKYFIYRHIFRTRIKDQVSNEEFLFTFFL